MLPGGGSRCSREKPPPPLHCISEVLHAALWKQSSALLQGRERGGGEQGMNPGKQTCGILPLTPLCFLHFPFQLLMIPMIMSVLYVWAQLNRDMIVSFWFGTRFKVRCIGWAFASEIFTPSSREFQPLTREKRPMFPVSRSSLELMLPQSMSSCWQLHV